MNNIGVFKIEIAKYSKLVNRLLRAKQHIYNGLVIIFNNSDDDKIKSIIRNYADLRRILSSSTSKKDNDEYFIEFVTKNYPSIFESFKEFYNTYSNKIFVDIVKSFNTSVSNNLKKSKENGTRFSLKTIKLTKIKTGSIELNSNIVSVKDNFIRIQIFSKMYKESQSIDENFKYYIDEEILKSLGNIKNAWFVKKNERYFLYIAHEKKVEVSATGDFCLAIDTGMKNHFTIVSNNNDAPSIIIKNKSINRINRIGFNIISKVQSKKDILKEKKDFGNNFSKCSRIIDTFNTERNILITNEFNKLSNRIIDYCKKYNITKIIYGYNKGQKNKVNMGTENNKKFLSIPHYQFKELLKYKAGLNGITFIEQEESYTSKMNCLSKNNEIWKYVYSNNTPTEAILKEQGLRGYKKNSNIYKSKETNSEFHADVNGAFNILMKYLKTNIKITNEQIFNPLKVSDDFQFLNILK